MVGPLLDPSLLAHQASFFVITAMPIAMVHYIHHDLKTLQVGCVDG
jgi:hypothetical protein